jgi:SH3-like domain-containing protein
MRPLVAILFCCSLLLPSTATAEPSFPYKATVVSDDVYVRSGPGQDYYPTSKLKRGEEVEVYRHDPGGWCRIRPVEGSFTWVSGRFLKPTKHNMAVVTQDGIAARVGSRFSDTRDVIQVRLHKDEVVEILEAPPADGHGANQWYKIAPPSGEFRWVSSKYLDADYPRDGIRKRTAEIHDSDAMVDDRSVESWRRHESSESAGEALLARSARSRPFSPQEFQAELERVDLELTTMIIDPDPTTWTFDELRDRANSLLDHSRTAVEHGRARQLATKIANFEDIKRRQEEVLAMRDRVDRSSRMYARLRPRDDANFGDRSARPDSAVSDIDDRFDGVGQLTQVRDPKIGAPRYALVDRSGKVRCYVTPAPGLNLQRYVGHDIGITGARSEMLDERSSHIMARHITPLEGTMLR